jgi:hypothetical protein
MTRCPTCGYILPEDRERLGARCPHCHHALYLPPGRFPRPAGEGEAACTIHPGSVSVGTCGRCGNFLCDTCRTRWEKSVLCPACVDRALQGKDGDPARQRGHARQAKLGLAAGIGAWVLTALIVGLAFVSQAVGQGSDGMVAGGAVLLVVLLLPFAVIVALIGLGQSVAALRTRGDSMILATLGLMLSGLHIGAMVGTMLFGIWLH